MGYKKNANKKLEIDLIESEVIKQVFELYSKGNSADKVARIMNEDYRYLRNNGKWTDDKVINIISNPIWNILSRKGKRKIISMFIKHIDISTDKNYNVKIENVTFNNRFLQNEFFYISTYLLDKLKRYYKNIKFLGMFTKEQIKNITTNELYSYNELMKNYTNDRKVLDAILNKYKDFNIELAMIIDDKKFVDVIVIFN